MNKQEEAILKKAIDMKNNSNLKRTSNIATRLGVKPEYLHSLYFKKAIELRSAVPKIKNVDICVMLSISETTLLNYSNEILQRETKSRLACRYDFNHELHKFYMLALFGLGGFNHG